MPTPDARLERRIAEFGAAVAGALGDRLVCCAVVGSVATGDWVAGRSDVNTVVVAEPLDATVLTALAPVARTYAADGFAVPVVVDREFLERGRDVFPMEIDDMRCAHRLLAGTDVLAGLVVERAAVRRQCEQEARGKLLRLRALCLAAPPEASLERAVIESLKSEVIVLRHATRLAGTPAGARYADVVAAAEHLIGPLPVMRRLLAHRDGRATLTASQLAGDLLAYLAEVERIVHAVDRLEA